MTNTEVVRQFYEALNANDVDGVVSLLDPDIVRVEFEGSPNGGTYRGLAELRKHVASGRSTWAEGACEPEDYLLSRDKVVVPVHVRVRLNDATEWIDGRVTDGYLLRDGKILEFRSFFERADALNWAGLKE